MLIAAVVVFVLRQRFRATFITVVQCPALTQCDQQQVVGLGTRGQGPHDDDSKILLILITIR